MPLKKGRPAFASKFSYPEKSHGQAELFGRPILKDSLRNLVCGSGPQSWLIDFLTNGVVTRVGPFSNCLNFTNDSLFKKQSSSGLHQKARVWLFDRFCT